MKQDKFFSRKYLYQTLWAILAGTILFVGNMIWERSKGPEAVVIVKKKPQGVTNKKTGKVHHHDYRQKGDSLHP